MAAEARADPPRDVLGTYASGQRDFDDVSLPQFAEMCQVSNRYLSHVERGLHQPSLKVLRAIVDALNISGESLLAQVGPGRAPGPSPAPAPRTPSTLT